LVRDVELGGKVATETTGPNGVMIFHLVNGSTVTVNTARTLIIQGPFAGLEHAQLILWGHADDRRDWLIATDESTPDDAIANGCYRVNVRGLMSDKSFFFVWDADPGTSQAINLGIRVPAALQGTLLTPRNDGTFDERAFCLNSDGSVVTQL
jgi:hypothetical protein